MTTEDEIAREAKQYLRQGVPDIVDLHEELAIVESENERRHILVVIAKMQQLISQGYTPEPMPELSKPTKLESGDLRFLAKTDAMCQRAEAALASQAVEDWMFFTGQDDEKVTGKVTSVEPVHALAYFTVHPADG